MNTPHSSHETDDPFENADETLALSIVDALPEAAFVTDPLGQIEFCNERARTHFGAPPADILSILKQRTHPDDLAELLEGWQRAIDTDSPLDTEFRLLQPAGEIYRIQHLQFNPIKDRKGQVTRWLGMVTDIHDRQRLEAVRRFLTQLASLPQSFGRGSQTLTEAARLAVATIADWCIIYLTDANGAVRHIEAAHSEFVKYDWTGESGSPSSVEHDLPAGIFSVWHSGSPEIRSDVHDEDLRALAHNEEELRTLREAGVTSLMVWPLKAQGNVVGAVLLASSQRGHKYDSTDMEIAGALAEWIAAAIEAARLLHSKDDEIARHTLEQARLLEREQRFQAMADAAPVLLWMTDTNGDFRHFNNSWLEFRGRTLAQEEKSGWTQGVYPADLALWKQSFANHFKRRQPLRTEFRLRRSDGEYRWMLSSGRARYASDGAFLGYIGSCVDITAHKAAEEENAALLHQIQNAAQHEREFLRDVLASMTQGRVILCDTAADLPLRLVTCDGEIDLAPPTLRVLREHTERASLTAGLPQDRWEDFITAVGEAALNAVMHAGGGIAHIYARAGTVQVWVEDTGGGIAVEKLPRATLERGYTTAGSFGHGFWLMLEMADRIWLLTGPTGTTVVLEQYCAPPEPGWLQAKSNSVATFGPMQPGA